MQQAVLNVISGFTLANCTPSCLFTWEVIASSLAPISYHQVLQTHDEVFNPNNVGYNDTAGPVLASVNMGPVQPP